MRVQDARTARAVLREEVGSQWLVVLLKAVGKSRALFRKTSWASSGGPEASFVRRLALPAAVYAQIQELPRIGEDRALKTLGKMILEVGCREQWNHLESLRTDEHSGMTRLMAFHDLTDERGAPKFNTRSYIEKSESRCHFVITRCVFMDFFTEVEASKLTRFFCEVDRRFVPKAFPDFDFDRGGTWENTIAYGQPQCESVFERRTPEAH